MIGQVLHLKREPDNCKDKYAVAIVLEDCVVGPVLYNLDKCSLSSKTGYGLEMPVVYCLY